MTEGWYGQGNKHSLSHFFLPFISCWAPHLQSLMEVREEAFNIVHTGQPPDAALNGKGRNESGGANGQCPAQRQRQMKNVSDKCFFL